MVKKKSKRNRRRKQIRIAKIVMFLIVILLPCVWLLSPVNNENEPMRVARKFADHLISARYDEAARLATPQSADNIRFYATWIGDNKDEVIASQMRYKITHAQLLMPSDTTYAVYGKVLVADEPNDERELCRLNLKMVYIDDNWKVDYDISQTVWQ